MNKNTFLIGRRQALQAGLMTAASSLLPSFAYGSENKILIGYWPIASGLPFYVALEKGYFKEVGLNVEGVKFASPNQIAEARDKGDLSENAEYDAAKEAQGLLEMKISKLEAIVANARLIDETHMDNSKVFILSKVTIKNVVNNAEMQYTLVAENEADLKEKKISVDSPIGKGLLGKTKGEIADVQTPNGILKFEIIDITR